MNTNYRKQFEKNLSNFKSEHPAGSKYGMEAYKTRSKLFRPKTRTAIRKNEAAIASALFSAQDVVILEAEDMDNPQKRRDAMYWHEVLNYRLTKTLPWFQLVVGAFQEAQIYGVVCSKQHWEYEEYETGEDEMVPDERFKNLPAMDNDGNPIFRPEMKVVKDRPKIRLVEIENVRFDPSCDWLDPVNSSPYFIELIPMYVCDVVERMGRVDDKTNAPEWQTLSKSQIIAYGGDAGQDASPAPDEIVDHDVSDFEKVWVHENIIRYGGEDWVFYTLSTRFLLSEPKPLKEVYEHGIRPYVVGKAIVEAHKAIPAGTVELAQTLQAEANDIVNQRLDNVKLALNKRYFAKRNSGVDLVALQRNVPGGIVLTDDVMAVREQETKDVTGSSYQEQARIDSDFDEIAGVFSTSSVQNNRMLNETVGGMEMMNQSANKEAEYLIRTFVETWVEPVLSQLVLLEQYYEDDEHIIDIARAGVSKKEQKIAEQTAPPARGQVPPGVEGAEPEMVGPMPGPLNAEGAAPPGQAGPMTPGAPPPSEVPLQEPQNVDVRVNVGFGNLSPDQRIKKVVTGLKILAEVAPWMMQKLDVEEVAQEVFGALGNKNGKRFFTDFMPPEPQQDPMVAVRMKELEIKEAELGQEVQFRQAQLAQERELRMMELALQENLTMAQIQTKLGIDREKQAQDKAIAGAKNLTVLAGVEQKEKELQFKAATGRQGI